MKQASRWGCAFAGLFLFLLIVVAGGWWFLSTRHKASTRPAPSAVLVFLLSPAGGSEIRAGDFTPVSAQVLAPGDVQSVELFVDGASQGQAASPQDPAWTWQAIQPGIHTLSARAATMDGQTGQSQAVIVNVLPGQGPLEVPAGEGQTLGEVGAGFGVPADQVAAANPHIDPGLPLPDGQPVQVPLPGGNPQGGSGSPESGFPNPGPISIPSISWQFTPSGPVDKSYCYTSAGGGIWQKMPVDPFEFFGGPANYLQTGIPLDGDQLILEAQCWGWLGDALKFLGQGQTKLSLQEGPQEVVISTEGFKLAGLPQFPALPTTGGSGYIVPPPFALREPADASDCSGHSHPLLAPFICKTLMEEPVKQHILLEWEWEPKSCWGGDCSWVNEIAGYRLYEFDPSTKSETLLKEIDNPDQKIIALPLPWGAKCYTVHAYVDNPAIADSLPASYCMNTPPKPLKMTLTPSDWLTTGGDWITQGCDNYGLLDPYIDVNQKSGFGNGTGEVFVGSDITDAEDCFEQADYSGAVKFPQPTLPPGAVVQKAVLSFSQVFTDYHAAGVATNYTLFCVGGVGRAIQSWTGLVTANHFVGSDVLIGKAYYSPLTTLGGWDKTPEVEVTSTVKSWISDPSKNHGFILRPAPALDPATDGFGVCESGAGNFQLDIYYFAQ